MRTIRIFLSSPGDCIDERNATHEVVATLNADPLISSFSRIEVVAWDWSQGVPLDAISSPQVSVNNHLATPEECDVFIGISRCRFGTPLPLLEFGKEDGTPFLSGSEYEFDRAWKARRRGASLPSIHFYRSKDIESGCCSDDAQVERTKAFFDAPPFKDQDGWTGSVSKFDSTQDYKVKVDAHLRKILSQWQPSTRNPLEHWLAEQARTLTNDAGPRYTKAAHLNSDISKVFDWLLVRPRAITTIDDLLASIWKDIKGVKEFSDIQTQLTTIGEQFRADPYWRSLPDFKNLAETLHKTPLLAWEIIENLESNSDAPNDSNSYKRHSLQTVASNAREATAILTQYSDLATKRVLLLSGEAGQGKTHTLVHEVNNILAEGGIAVGVLGQTLSSSNDLTAALQSRWGFDTTLQQFLDSLQNAAEQTNQRALIVIDALNETPNRLRWKHELSGILEQILTRPQLTVAISVRTDYLKHVLPPPTSGQEAKWVQVEHSGFAGIESDALHAYCKHYNVHVPVAPPLGELSNPLYVQLLVKSLQGRPPADHWLPSWLEVWSAWMDRLEDDALGTINLDPSRPEPIHRTLNQLAKKMLESNQFHISREQAEEVSQSTTGTRDVIGFLCSAGALIDRINQDEEIIEYGFERLCDTFVIDRLLDNLFEGIEPKKQRREILKQALSSTGSLNQLAFPSYDEGFLSIHRAGLLEALCLAVPIQADVEVPELIPIEEGYQYGVPGDDWELRQAFTDSFRWRCKPNEFALHGDNLWEAWLSRGYRMEQAEYLDELIRLSLVPKHPFTFENIIHPWLTGLELGERDEVWSVPLVQLWHEENSNLQTALQWGTRANLENLHEAIALPSASLFAWLSSVPQQKMRKDAIQSLTRILVSCPACLPKFLPDFLAVNDVYILEAVLVATWGVVIDGRDPTLAAEAARLVYVTMFKDGNAVWCHLTIRHYARQIVEDAVEKGLLTDIDLAVVHPPYQSSLPLDQVPEKKALRECDTSSGFGSIVSSALGHDFYWYVMGATSGPKPFASRPLSNSKEFLRAYPQEGNAMALLEPSIIFNIPLAARFVAWNCLQLGWTGKRFNEFDTGHYVQGHGRISPSGRTERIGKKYQWISWQTMLGFLSDNYEMTSEGRDIQRIYDSPHQISYIEIFDPSRWLQISGSAIQQNKDEAFWEIPSMPPWPLPIKTDLQRWASNTTYDLPDSDIICTIPKLPESWGRGPWMRIAAEHIWHNSFAPGYWALGYEYSADIWRQIMPALIKSSDLPELIHKAQKTGIQKQNSGYGRCDYDSDWDTPLADWPLLEGDFDRDFDIDTWDMWPVPWMPLAGHCGDPDENDERRQIIVPWPRLFREWGLVLDLHNGVIRRNEEIVFGLAGWSLGEDALFAQSDVLQNLLKKYDYTLVWWLCGERRAWLELDHLSDPKSSAWVDTYGIAYLGLDGRVNIACSIRNQRGR